MLYLINWIT